MGRQGGIRQRAGSAVEGVVATMVSVYRHYSWVDGRYQPVQLTGFAPTAFLVRQNPPVHVRARGDVRLSGRAVTDYFGAVLGADTRLVAFDVKGLGVHSSFQLKPAEAHQLAFIREVRKAGGLGFFLLVDIKHGWAWLIERDRDLALLATGASVTICERKKGVPEVHHVSAVPRALVPGVGVFGFDFLRPLIEGPPEVTDVP